MLLHSILHTHVMGLVSQLTAETHQVYVSGEISHSYPFKTGAQSICCIVPFFKQMWGLYLGRSHDETGMEDFSLCVCTFYQREGGVYVPNSFFIWWNEKKTFICDLEWESKSIRINGLFLCLQDVVDENVVCGEF